MNKFFTIILVLMAISSLSLAQGHLVITEIAVTPTVGEFIEFYNPTGDAIDLSDVYLTDATFSGGGTYYYFIVDTFNSSGGGGFADFHSRFPDGASIAAGEYQTVAMDGEGFQATYGMDPTYVLWDTTTGGLGIPVMREATEGSINDQGGFSNAGEMAVIYHWDGNSDLVEDHDYVVWGDKVEAVDKTGIKIDGIDVDTDSTTYLDDTAIATQIPISTGQPHQDGETIQRLNFTENGETLTGGNGASGHDETSEDLATSFQVRIPTPNAAAPPPVARVQVIHNSADLAADTVDVWLNDTPLLPNFAFRTASPFVDAPAGVEFDITIQPKGSSDTTNGLWRKSYTLTENETYILVASGIVSASGYDPVKPFDIAVYGMGQEAAGEGTNTDLLVYHGSTDAPTVDVVAEGAGTIVDDISYFEFEDNYLALPTADYKLIITDSTGATKVVRYKAPLETLGLEGAAAVVFASGFLDPTKNSDGPAFGVYVALPAGGDAVALPVNTDPVMITFRANASRIEGLVDTTGAVDLRGQVQEQEWTPWANPMDSDGGDYWSLTLSFDDADIGTNKLYKYGGTIVDPVSGDTIFGPPPATNQGWENDLPGAGSDYLGNDRDLDIPYQDTVLPLDFIGWKDGPFVDDPDTIQVHFRVNMSTYPGFDANTDEVFLAGSMPDASWGDSHTMMVREGPNSKYFNFTSKVAAIGESFSASWKFTRGSWDGNEEKFPDNEQYPGGNRSAPGITQDTTIQFKYYNDVIPSGPTGEDTVIVKWTVDMTAARDAKGFNIGDTLIVEWGFLGTADQEEDTLTNVFLTNLYTATDTAKSVSLGENLLYQYYHIARGSRDRELFFDFTDETGDNLSREKRKILLTAPAPEMYEIEDTEESTSSMRRQPTFRNSEPIENDVTVYWEVDLRPAYYQVLEGDTLIDIQGIDDVTEADSVFAWGVWMNGPAVGDWTNPQPGASDWGSGLRGNPLKKMYDDGATGGDQTAGDSVYTLEWFYTSDSTLVKGQVYKFGIYGGDNEAGNDKSFGNNHVANIDDSNSPTTIHTQFGSINPLFYTMWDFDSNTPTSVGESNNAIVIRDPNLRDNYPNPFNPTTTLTFELPKQMEVELVVFDVLGRKVIELVNGVQRQGVHKVVWNGADNRGRPVSSGVYFYRMTTDNYQRTMKMVLMR